MRPLTPRRILAICGLLFAVLFVAVVISLRMGAYPISVPDIVMTLVNAAIGRPILVVTDEAGGLVRGSIVNFVETDRHVRFEISLTAADHSNLKINSGLLSVAAHVEGGRPRADLPCWQSPIFGAGAGCSRRTRLARLGAGAYLPVATGTHVAERGS